MCNIQLSKFYRSYYYVLNRSQSTNRSCSSTVVAGVPQDSHFLLFLFALFIYDTNYCFLYCKISLHLKTFCEICVCISRYIDDVLIFQRTCLYTYCVKNKIVLNLDNNYYNILHTKFNFCWSRVYFLLDAKFILGYYIEATVREAHRNNK